MYLTPPAGQISLLMFIQWHFARYFDYFAAGGAEEVFYEACYLSDDTGTFEFVITEYSNLSSCEPIQFLASIDLKVSYICTWKMSCK